jgi:hypothetical protein
MALHAYRKYLRDLLQSSPAGTAGEPPGYSRETSPHMKAEESILEKLADADPQRAAAAIYSLEPCSECNSSPVTCTQLWFSDLAVMQFPIWLLGSVHIVLRVRHSMSRR